MEWPELENGIREEVDGDARASMITCSLLPVGKQKTRRVEMGWLVPWAEEANSSELVTRMFVVRFELDTLSIMASSWDTLG